MDQWSPISVSSFKSAGLWSVSPHPDIFCGPQTEASVTEIIKKLNQMPLKAIGDNLEKSLADLDLTLVTARGTLTSARGTLDNTSSLTASNSVQLQQLNETLQEWSRAARSVSELTDFLEQHPEALLHGKKEGASEK